MTVKLKFKKGSWSKHIRSREHLSNIGKDDKEEFEKIKWMKCPVCDDYDIQLKNYKRHTTTMKHQDNFKKKKIRFYLMKHIYKMKFVLAVMFFEGVGWRNLCYNNLGGSGEKETGEHNANLYSI